jgi:hypothetical protein
MEFFSMSMKGYRVVARVASYKQTVTSKLETMASVIFSPRIADWNIHPSNHADRPIEAGERPTYGRFQ